MLWRLAAPSASIARHLRGAGRGARNLSRAAERTDGFNEGLPRGDIIAPALCAAVYGFAWFAADEGNIQKLAEQVDVNTDPEKNPTPNQVFHHLWPYVAGTLGMLFESVTCKFSQTKDMDWLCTTALNDDTNAAVALSLLVPPAEYSPTFVRAICARPGALRRTKEIVQIYKTLPREQHDDVVVNACILMAKVAQLPELKADGLGVADFVWMMPDDKAYMYTQYGLEGLAHLWKEDTSGLLTSGGVLRTAELIDGRALMPSKAESAIMNQLVAHHLLNAFAEDRASLLEQVGAPSMRMRIRMRIRMPNMHVQQHVCAPAHVQCTRSLPTCPVRTPRPRSMPTRVPWRAVHMRMPMHMPMCMPTHVPSRAGGHC